ncbi:MAG: ATP-binding cassette domain-containing protein [Myxococcales bacterium]|nr:ATP-binding cassette domain-containing protein [Myxococcales bacterium]
MVVHVADLAKHYRVADKQPGVVGTLRHFVRRKHRIIEAVRGVSFDIARGEMVGFLGPNGAGKTTTLKMLTGLVHPTTGEATVSGFVPFRRHADFLRQITLVMGQKQQLVWDLPALDSLRINAAVYDVPKAEAEQRIGALAEMLSITDILTQPVRKLSLGQRMKAELLAALLHRPSVVFLDEPTLGLDVNAQTAVRAFLRDYNERYGATILLTSHYMADITALCERVLLVHDGRLVYDGDLAAMVARVAPHREVEVELEQPLPAEQLAALGEIERVDGCVVRWLVPHGALTRTVAQIMQTLPVRDLRVTDPPIEEIIGRVFAGPAPEARA